MTVQWACYSLSKPTTTMSKFLLLLPFFFMVSVTAEPSLNFTNCPLYYCSGVTITYPFWRIDSKTTTHFCGYEGFGINCSSIDHRDHPIITFRGHSYYVENINYDHHSLTLVDTDAAFTADDCPRVHHSIDLSTLPLNFSSSNVNLSFHFNCTRVPAFATVIRCLSSATNESCVHELGSEMEDFDWDKYCNEEVVTAVMNKGISRGGRLAAELGVALKSGFELNWRSIKGCGTCEGSDGRCGHDYETDKLMCFCSDGSTTTDHCNSTLHQAENGYTNNHWQLIAEIFSVGASVIFILVVCKIYLTKKLSSSNFIELLKFRTKDERSVEAFIKQYGSLTTKRYRYVDIKKMTNSFQVKLGQGGFGCVFKGILVDGRLVAVKVLNSSKANGKDFVNEVASISRTSHVNVVTLLGFCFECGKRALVYEFMPNGSLEKFIYRHVPLPTNEQLGVNKLYEIALGIARGLDYLHRGCNTRILHLDIKPHNILLDEEFCPKISDFGLAKLYSWKESIVSMLEARGTIGYIAPEIYNRNFGRVSHKSDVYSYGMMILEMVGGRKNVDTDVGSGRSSEIYFPYWIYNRLEKDDVLLEGLITMEENDFARKMIIVGLWCIQTDPARRPSIDEVIEMLEGSTEALQFPPKPFFCSPQRSPAVM